MVGFAVEHRVRSRLPQYVSRKIGQELGLAFLAALLLIFTSLADYGWRSSSDG